MIGRKRKCTASGRFLKFHSPVNTLFGKLYNQDGIFSRQTDQRDQTDLCINVIGRDLVLKVKEQDCPKCP